MKSEDINTLSFEEAIAKLETIVRELESGRTKLDDAVSSYEKAVSLKKLCETKLQNAKLKIEQLTISSDESVSSTEFNVPEE